MNNLSKINIDDIKPGYKLGYADVSILREALRELLAYREAAGKPVAHIFQHPQGKLFWAISDDGNAGSPGVIPVYAAPQLPAVPDDLLHMAASAIEDLLDHIDPATSYYAGVWADVPGKLRSVARKAEQQNSQQNIPKNIPAGNSPEIPDGWAFVPRKLTAENGAKSALLGEFLETKYISCPECFGDEECESCDGSGRIKVDVTVSWDTIKRIYSSAIDLFCKEGEMLAVKLASAASDVLAERGRQVNTEGWATESDDNYEKGELADAAACYAAHAHAQGLPAPLCWPWDRDWWKQTDTRRDLVKAGALILAEIERIDRAAAPKLGGDNG